MLYFENNRVYQLCPAEYKLFEPRTAPLLAPDERVIISCLAVHDGIVFTDSRILSIDIQGMLGTKADVTSLYYKSVEAFAVDKTAEGGELELFLAGQKRLRFVFSGVRDLSPLSAALSRYTM